MGSQQPDEPETSLTDRVVAAVRETARTKGDPQPLLVGIDGRSGSGKTVLAAAVAERIDRPVLHLDDLYPGWDGLAAAPEILAEEVLRPLRAGGAGAYRRWDWVAGRPGEVVHLPWTPVLLVEGCGAGASPAGELLDLLVWLDAPTDVRRRRALGRDGDIFAPHWQRWADQEDTVLAGVRERADLVLDTEALR